MFSHFALSHHIQSASHDGSTADTETVAGLAWKVQLYFRHPEHGKLVEQQSHKQRIVKSGDKVKIYHLRSGIIFYIGAGCLSKGQQVTVYTKREDEASGDQTVGGLVWMCQTHIDGQGYHQVLILKCLLFIHHAC
jgi:hypothetical protein